MFQQEVSLLRIYPRRMAELLRQNHHNQGTTHVAFGRENAPMLIGMEKRWAVFMILLGI
jgi:hypothetical protein